MKKNKSKRKNAFEDVRSDQWLSQELPLLCEAVRMEPGLDPWAKKGKIVGADCATELRRKRLQELSLNVEHFIADESGAAVA